jgi:hypothetical protein
LFSIDATVIWGQSCFDKPGIGGGLGFLNEGERRVSDSPKECRTCYWWERNKQAKKGSCNRMNGQIVNHPERGNRIAYPQTVSDESCDHHREKK